MINLFKEILLDFQDQPLSTGISRRYDIVPVPYKATIYIGVRRSGKSTLLFQRMEQLIQSGVSRKNILFINFFDDRLHLLSGSDLHLIIEAYYSLYPEKKGTEKVYCFFDELQMVTGFEPFIDRLLRSENCEVYITGSSAQMLSKEIATQMRGRALSWEIFPFSFEEFLDFKSLESQGPFSTKKRLFIQRAFGEFWETGGFPETVELSRSLRIKIHQEYFHAILYRDLIERHDIAHPKALIDLAHWLIDNAGSLYSINNLTGYLKSLGHRISKSVVSDYLNWFEDTYFLFTVRIFDASLTRANANSKKIYCIDHALISSVSSGILMNDGHRLENMAFIALRRLTSHIFYYRTAQGREVDFIAQLSQKSWILIQVCESILHPDTRKREITALEQAMIERQHLVGILVTRNEEEIIELESGKIEVIPMWRFLLRLCSADLA